MVSLKINLKELRTKRFSVIPPVCLLISVIYILLRDKSSVNCWFFHLLQLDTSLLSSYLPEVTRMARKFTHISTLLQVQLCYTILCSLMVLQALTF